jgi:hypothetical protein
MTFLINHFERAAQAALGTAHKQQSSNRIDRRTLAPDNFAHVRGMHAQLVNGGSVTIRSGNRHRVGPVNQPFNYVVQKGFHK